MSTTEETEFLDHHSPSSISIDLDVYRHAGLALGKSEKEQIMHLQLNKRTY